MSNSIFSVIGTRTRQLLEEKLNLTGGTLTGSLILHGDPTQDNEAASKGYIDTKVTQLSQYARLDGASFTGDVSGTNLTLSGNLEVQGSITAVKTTNTTITDSIISLSQGTKSSANASKDAGILIERGNTEENAAVYWDEGDDRFRFITTSSDATVSDLGSGTIASVALADLNTNGNDLGKLEEFYAGLLISSGTVSIPTSEFDAVAISGVASIVGIQSPFASVTIFTTYGTPEEISYNLNFLSSDETSGTTLVSLELTSISAGALDEFRGTGKITFNSETDPLGEVTFS